MNKYLFRNGSLRVFNEAISSTWSALLNIALLVALLISLFTPYVGIGIATAIIISAVEILFVVGLYDVLKSTSIRYKVIAGEIEWSIDRLNPGIVKAKRRFTIKLLQTAKSICYYLAPTERIIATPNLLAVFSEKRCEDKNYGYVPVELYFPSYYPRGAEIEIEIETETRSPGSSKLGSVSFHTHNKPQQLNLYFSISKNGHDHHLTTKVEYKKGHRRNLVGTNDILFRRKDVGRKLVWESDQIVDDAIYEIQWEFD